MYAPSCKVNVSALAPEAAESVTVWAELTGVAVAVKEALLVPAATRTAAGTVRAPELLARFTLSPPDGAAPFSATVQTSVADPNSELLPQLNEVSAGKMMIVPVPLRLIVVVSLLEELLVIVSCPASAPEVFGLNPTFSVMLWLGFRVCGPVNPETENPPPLITTEFTVTGAFPEEVSVTACVAAALTFTFPKAMLERLGVSCDTVAPNSKATDCDTPPALAVNVAVCADETAFTDAVKFALVAPGVTLTVEGTVTALLLRANATVAPPLPTAAVIATAHWSVADPIKESPEQLNPLRTGALTMLPAPLKLTVVVSPLSELLVMVSCPLTAPVVAGAKFTPRL
jgi:hypothetical protein